MADPSQPLAPKIEFIQPSADMMPIIHTLFVMSVGAGPIEDVMPAYSAQFFSFVQGEGVILFHDREPGKSGDIVLNAPMLRAAPMAFDGPV